MERHKYGLKLQWLLYHRRKLKIFHQFRGIFLYINWWIKTGSLLPCAPPACPNSHISTYLSGGSRISRGGTNSLTFWKFCMSKWKKLVPWDMHRRRPLDPPMYLFRKVTVSDIGAPPTGNAGSTTYYHVYWYLLKNHPKSCFEGEESNKDPLAWGFQESQTITWKLFHIIDPWHLITWPHHISYHTGTGNNGSESIVGEQWRLFHAELVISW